MSLPQTRCWVPAGGSREADRVATGIIAHSDIIEYLRISILGKSDVSILTVEVSSTARWATRKDQRARNSSKQRRRVCLIRQGTWGLTRVGLINPTVGFPAASLASLINVMMEAQTGADAEVPLTTTQEPA